MTSCCEEARKPLATHVSQRPLKRSLGRFTDSFWISHLLRRRLRRQIPTSTFSPTSLATKTTFWTSLSIFFCIISSTRLNSVPTTPRWTQTQDSTHHLLPQDFGGPGHQTLSTRSIPRDTIAGENPQMFLSKPLISRIMP